MNKKKTKLHKFGSDYYYLGQDCYGKNYFLEQATFDCGWYWGGGYVQTFTNNRNPAASRDISSHSHFDTMFFNNKRTCAYDAFTTFFDVTPFSKDEIWKICELMNAFYTARRYADMLYIGGTNYTRNPATTAIQSESEYKRINEVVIPAIMSELYVILSPDKDVNT